MPKLNKILFTASRNDQSIVTFEEFVWDFARNLRPSFPQQWANAISFDKYRRGHAGSIQLYQKNAICNIFIFVIFLVDSVRLGLSSRLRLRKYHKNKDVTNGTFLT